MQRQAVDLAALASRPFLAQVAPSVRKLPAVTARRLHGSHASTRSGQTVARAKRSVSTVASSWLPSQEIEAAAEPARRLPHSADDRRADLPAEIATELMSAVPPAAEAPVRNDEGIGPNGGCHSVMPICAKHRNKIAQ